MKRIYYILAVIFVLFVGVVSLNGCASCDRTVTLYGYNGNVIDPR